jgi:hypothetical protein
MKKSIICSKIKSNEVRHEKSQNQGTYDIFYRLFPFLKELGGKNISIRKCWSVWHPLNKNQNIPTNKYDEDKDKYYTRIYKNWISKNNS